MVLVHYPCDRSVWHDFGQDGCVHRHRAGRPHPRHAPPHRRRLRWAGGPDGRYALSADYVHTHFTSCGESAWLRPSARRSSPCAGRQAALEARAGARAALRPRQPAKALRHAGNARGAERPEADCGRQQR